MKHCKCCKQEKKNKAERREKFLARIEYITKTHPRYQCDPFVTCKDCR